MIRLQAYTESGLMPASMLKGLDALPNYSKWSKIVCEQDSVTYSFDGPKSAKGAAARVAKMKAEAK